MSLMEIATGSLIGLIVLNPTNIAMYLPILGVSIIALIYSE